MRKLVFAVIAVGVIAAAAAMPAGAHNGPATCTLAASPALVNNVEMGPPNPTTNPMNPAAVGHQGQKRGDGNRFGLYYPATDPLQDHWTQTGPFGNPPEGTGLIPATKGDNFNWRQTGTCAEGAAYSASGTGIGYCGRSVGYGTGTVGGGHTTIIRWESFGTQLILADTTPNKTVIGSVNAQANPPGSPNGSCVDGGAAVFVVDGVLVHM